MYIYRYIYISPQIWTPFLGACVSKRAQRTRVSRCSLSSIADLARVKSSKKGSRSGGFSDEFPGRKSFSYTNILGDTWIWVGVP